MAFDLGPPAAIAKPQLVIGAIADGRRLGLQLVYSAGLSKAMVQAGAAWCSPRRAWVIKLAPPAAATTWLAAAMPEQGFDGADAQRQVQTALDAPQPSYFTEVLDLQVFPLVGGHFAVSFEYDAWVIATMRVLGGRFHRAAKAWEVQARPEVILQALAHHAGVASEFVFVHEQALVLEEIAASKSGPVPISVPAAPPEFGLKAGAPREDSGNGFLSTIGQPSTRIAIDQTLLLQVCHQAKLRDYQVVGVQHLAGQTSACLGDDMGLGKSRQTVVAARLAAGAGRVLILCPATLRENWQREIHAVYPNEVVAIAGEDRISTMPACQWVVANYERLGGLVREVSLTFEVMAIDEAHYLKEHHAGRTRNAFLLAARIPRRFIVTGTPLLSREIELHTLLRLSGHPLGAMPLADFRSTFAGDSQRRALLAQQLQGWMLRRRKDVLSELGTKDRQVRTIKPTQGMASYEAIVKDMRLGVMPKITKLRQALEALKLEFIVQCIESAAPGDKFIVFCEYMATVNQLQHELAGQGTTIVSVVGSDAPKARQRAIDQFQTDPAVTVFIGTTSAAGVGITLTAANYVLFASLPWTPAQMRQAEDRAYRLGQKRNVIVIAPLIANSIDEQIWQLLQAKWELEEDVVEAVVSELCMA